LFTHVTVVPREMLTGFGLYAVVVSVLAPDTIETVVPGGEGVDDGVVGVELFPHPPIAMSAVATRMSRADISETPPFGLALLASILPGTRQLTL
jgi:hypothetical protein